MGDNGKWVPEYDARAWGRLAVAVGARRGELNLSPGEVDRRGGPSIELTKKIEGGGGHVQVLQLWRLEVGLDWRHGTCEVILADPDADTSDHTLSRAAVRRGEESLKGSPRTLPQAPPPPTGGARSEFFKLQERVGLLETALEHEKMRSRRVKQAFDVRILKGRAMTDENLLYLSWVVNAIVEAAVNSRSADVLAEHVT